MINFFKAFLIAVASLLGISSPSSTIPTPTPSQIQSVATSTPISTPIPSPTPTPTPIPTPAPTVMPTLAPVTSPTTSGQTQALTILKEKMDTAQNNYQQASQKFDVKSKEMNQCRTEHPQSEYGEKGKWINETNEWVMYTIPDPCAPINTELQSASFDLLWYGKEYSNLEKQYLYILGQK